MNIFLCIVSAIASSIFGSIGMVGFIHNVVADPKWHKPIPTATIILSALVSAITFVLFAHFLDTAVHIK